jgi:hypothetical protein
MTPGPRHWRQCIASELSTFSNRRNNIRTLQSTPSYEKQPHDAAYWAQNAATLQVARAPIGALNLNVEGRRAMIGELRYPRLPVRAGNMQLGTSLTLWLIVRLLTHNEHDFTLTVTAL